jgi:hypothetical protein
MAALGGDEQARARELDLLRHQVAEIDSAAVALDRSESSAGGQAGDGPDGGDEADAKHDQAAAERCPGQLAGPHLAGWAHQSEESSYGERTPESEDEKGQEVLSEEQRFRQHEVTVSLAIPLAFALKPPRGRDEGCVAARCGGGQEAPYTWQLRRFRTASSSLRPGPHRRPRRHSAGRWRSGRELGPRGRDGGLLCRRLPGG